MNTIHRHGPRAHRLTGALRLALMGGCIAGAAALLPSAASAQEETPSAENAKALDVISVLGSRKQPRSEANSPVPVDIISGEEFHNQGLTDVLDQIRTVVPSLNVNLQPISDAATLVRPANLRGLPPDSTLVLVNGKRRHRSAVITFLGSGLSDGSQGPDISVFPSIALSQVEVLRDGAAAQYGSDAIAGVINFNLKSDREGGSLEVLGGQHYAGDGTTAQVAGNIGLPFSPQGFANLSFEYREADPTDRSVQRGDAAEVAASGNPFVPDPAQVWGSPEVKRDFKLVANLGLELNDDLDWYLFGNAASRDIDGGFYYRNPVSRAGVFSGDGGETLLIGNLGGAACPTIALRDAAGNLRPFSAVNAQVTALPANCYTFFRDFPGGFTPRFGGVVRDGSLVTGVRGTTAGGLRWDLSASQGRSEVDFYIYNTVNASMGPNQPEGYRFNPGAYEQTETNFNLDLVKVVDAAWTQYGLSVAGGLEWREEQFEAFNGDQASFEIGPLASQGFLIGSNGFPGFSPRDAGSWSRSNYAAYVDLEADLSERLLLATALRFEDFEDFGTTTNWKLTGRFQATDALALRGAVSTGFRAPTPGQSNVRAVTTQFIGGELRDTATLPPTNPIAQRFGGQPLQPEESFNLSFGAVYSLDAWLFTADYYRIDVEDRIAQSANFALTPADRAALVAQGVQEAISLDSVRFFINDFDTKTDGVDLVTSYESDHFGGDTTYALAMNWNRTEVTDFSPAIIGEARVQILEDALPRTKGSFSINHQRERWHAMTRLNYYGSFYEDHVDSGCVVGPDCLPIYGDAALIVDAEVGYKFDNGLFVNVGAQNLFDKEPELNPYGEAVVGAKFPPLAPYGFNGGFYYVRMGWRF
ncbi:TonB-dependent receptor [uncultured Aquimonas sp.]|uniref:TonB-dependent receptor plug domain-containing protein n=1 Tax=uncultured Aquimonas sp. TaxID=385483 RepID=UPI00086A09F6|nr:TonB-dependent receptor [uncultured Aquimonas sp.]ODU46251.1 MAG: TonB-dependent receptor [Xanthomonadaceae bacterium SCN 69-123]